MANIFDRVKVATATNGTGTITLGAAEPGFRTFAQGGATNGLTITYVIEEGLDWEIGTGVYSSTGPTLTRATIISSSNAGAALYLTGYATVMSTLTKSAYDDKADTNHSHSAATTALAGFMSAADKVKLNGLSNYTHPTTDGNRHVPVTAAADVNEFLKSGASAGANPIWAQIQQADVIGLVALLATLAPLISPNLTGSPTAPTPALGNNSTLIATTAFVQAAIAALINAAPGALDTLDELAAAMGDDPNFAATITNALALKAPITDAALLGNPTAPTQAAGNNTTRIATTAFVTAALAVLLAGTDTNTNTLGKLATLISGKLSSSGGVFSGGFSGGDPVALSGSTISPTLADGLFRSYTNSGAFVVSGASLVTGTYDIDITVVNAASGAGAVSYSGFTWADLTGFPTTANAVNSLWISVRGARKILTWSKQST